MKHLAYNGPARDQGGPVDHIFISYSRTRDYVKKLAAHLEASGLEVWFDHEILTGERWTTVIERKIETCGAMIVVMSPAARSSEMVENEVTLARSLRKELLPLLLEGEPFFWLNHIQYTDVRDDRLPGPDFVARLRVLVGAPPPSTELRDDTRQAPIGITELPPRSAQRASVESAQPHGREVSAERVPQKAVREQVTAPPNVHKSPSGKHEHVMTQRVDGPGTSVPVLSTGLSYTRVRPSALHGGRADGPHALRTYPRGRPVKALSPESRVVSLGESDGLRDVIAIAGGRGRSLFLHGDGHVTIHVTHQQRADGLLAVLEDLRDVTAIAMCGAHYLVLHRDGRVSVWGGPSPLSGGPRNIVAVTTGESHSVALQRDGHVIAWGNNVYGQARVPDGLQDVTDIKAGFWHSLALHRDGHVTAWGNDENGQVTLPEGLSDVTSIAAGGGHSLALHRDGHVTAWGLGIDGQASVPDGLHDVTAVAAGGDHSLALHGDGHVTAWGYSHSSKGDTAVPDGLRDVTAVAAGDGHCLALHRDGHVTAWVT